MKTMQKFFFMMLVVLMGGMVTSCGSDDANDIVIDNYTLIAQITDKGSMSDLEVQAANELLAANPTTFPKLTLALAKEATNTAIQQSLSGFASFANCTIEFALYDSNNKKVYSRYVIVKDGVVTLQ
jgi:hypothetical protein